MPPSPSPPAKRAKFEYPCVVPSCDKGYKKKASLQRHVFNDQESKTGSLTWWPGGSVVCYGGRRLRVSDWGRSTCDLESTPRGLNPGN
jgi:hypothetical protein